MLMLLCDCNKTTSTLFITNKLVMTKLLIKVELHFNKKHR